MGELQSKEFVSQEAADKGQYAEMIKLALESDQHYMDTLGEKMSARDAMEYLQRFEDRHELLELVQ
jgi:hypothetical protein